jgi:hypothetical protein
MNLKTLILIIVIFVLIIECSLFENDENTYSGITETIIESYTESGYPNGVVISEDPDDWKYNFSPSLPDSQYFPPLWTIGPAFPNPVVDSTFIQVDWGSNRRVNIQFIIKDKYNDLVKIVYDDTIDVGRHYLWWHLDNNKGMMVNNDIYRCYYKFNYIFSEEDSINREHIVSGYGDIKVE